METYIGTILSLSLAILLLNLHSVEATSILRPGDQLNSTWNLVSDGGNFTLGFFTIPETNYSYLGLWYTNDDQARKVWVGNPNRPLNINDSGVLTIDTSGTLKIDVRGNTLMNISDHFRTSNTTAILEDSGNFLLVDAVDNRTLWQSFDHPTNTLLPGMKLGFNRTTGENWTLISWLRDSVPASGAFTLGLEAAQDSGQMVIRRRGEMYWTSGPWNYNDQSFPFIFQLNESMMYWHNLTFTSSNDGMYLTFYTIPGEIFRWGNFSGDSPTFSMLELIPEGQILDGKNGFFVTPTFCYGYERDNGCTASEMDTCRSSRDTFGTRRGSFPNGKSTYDDNSSLSLSDCMKRCWNDCDCAGFYGSGIGCIMYYGKFQSDETGSAVQINVLLSSKVRSKSWIWILIALLIFVVLLASGLLSCLLRRRKLQDAERRRREEILLQMTTTNSFNEGNEVENNGREPHDMKIFSFSSIMVATKNFSSKNKLGEGGFGPVYKGRLHDGREIAVKRLSRTSGQGIAEFKTELILIYKLQHTNLVRVLGCCIHQEEKMLIYEFMCNKSLDYFLFAPDRKEKLDWQTRFNIMEGVAQGLLYLHKYSRMRVIHRDLKASNVLLDENMHPKIADFGMARIFKQNETEAVTNRVVGTYGYMSPEYAMEGNFSVKSDVFSFGVLVLEIVSGRRNTSFHTPNRPLNLIGHAWKLWNEGNAFELKDLSLRDSYDKNQILRCIHTGLLCVQENATDRPEMQDVVAMLGSESMSLPSPKQPAYFTGRSIPEATLPAQKATGNSVQDFSITEIGPR